MNKFTTIDFANQRLFGDGYTGSRYANAGYMAQYFLARGVLTDNQIKSIYNSGAGNPDLRTIIH
ncbi:MAG: hypothetical protein LBE56_12450 [Tannerella sp.]|jgi:hypothetical protein|nr:hypothetical protein [Tannerella sp.]